MTDNDDKKQKDQDRASFINFNVILLGGVALLALAGYLMPTAKRPLITSPMMLNNVLPLVYFALFSVFFGALFLIGNEKMKAFLLDHFPSKTLDLGIIAAYTGAVAIILAIILKDMIQKGFGVTIRSKPIHDVIGFIIGRLILLAVVNKVDV